MKNKWLIMFIFIIAVTLFLSIDTSKVKFNGDSEYNFNYYYTEFKDTALDTTTGVINGVIKTMNNISNIFNNIWDFILTITGNNSVIINLKDARGNATINNFNLLEKKQLLTAEYFSFSIDGYFNQIVLIGKNYLGGSTPGIYWEELEEDPNYINFDYTNQVYDADDYQITIYNTNTFFKSILSKSDLFALNDIDLIVIPLSYQQRNEDIFKTLQGEVRKNFDETIDKISSMELNFWLIQDIDENETGVIGSWVKNYTPES